MLRRYRACKNATEYLVNGLDLTVQKNLLDIITYNKTCDHTVVHYRSCKNEEDMATAETMVISRLRDFKEQANRDRFVLPENKDVAFFINTVDQCVEFLN